MAQSITSPAMVSRPIEDLADLVLAKTRSWGFVVLVTACFALGQIWLVGTGRYLHDEGILTWMYASYLGRDPVATVFFLKAKPALAALNLPGTLFGVTGFYAGHIAIGCVGIVATAAAGHAARLREWGVATLVFACSPMYLVGTAAGFSNVDVAALTAVALWMILRSPKPGFGTAVLISLLPWVRFEAGVFAVVSAVSLLLRDRNPRFLVGLLALPVIYLSAGALWHGDPLWVVHFPAAPHFVQAGVYGGVEQEVRRTSVSDILFALTTVTPALGLALSCARPAPWVHAARLCLVVFVIAIVGLPQTGFAMGYSQRYFLAILPVVALLVARHLEHAPRRLLVGALAIVAVGTLPALVAPLRDGQRAAFAISALVGSLLVAVLAMRRYPRLAAVGLAAFLVAWPLARPPLDASPADLAAVPRRVLDWLRAHPGQLRAPRILVTNVRLLDATLERAKDLPALDVRCLIQNDSEYEMRELTNPANGQRERIVALARWRFYGHGVFAREFAAHPGPEGALVVLQNDARLVATDADTLAKGGTMLLRSPDLSILRLDAASRAEDAAP